MLRIIKKLLMCLIPSAILGAVLSIYRFIFA